MSGILHAEVVTLHTARETLADTGTGDVDLLVDLEEIEADFAADFDFGRLVVTLGAELPEAATGFDTAAGKMPGFGLVEV